MSGSANIYLPLWIQPRIGVGCAGGLWGDKHQSWEAPVVIQTKQLNYGCWIDQPEAEHSVSTYCSIRNTSAIYQEEKESFFLLRFPRTLCQWPKQPFQTQTRLYHLQCVFTAGKKTRLHPLHSYPMILSPSTLCIISAAGWVPTSKLPYLHTYNNCLYWKLRTPKIHLWTALILVQVTAGKSKL